MELVNWLSHCIAIDKTQTVGNYTEEMAWFLYKATVRKKLEMERKPISQRDFRATQPVVTSESTYTLI